MVTEKNFNKQTPPFLSFIGSIFIFPYLCCPQSTTWSSCSIRYVDLCFGLWCNLTNYCITMLHLEYGVWIMEYGCFIGWFGICCRPIWWGYESLRECQKYQLRWHRHRCISCSYIYNYNYCKHSYILIPRSANRTIVFAVLSYVHTHTLLSVNNL